MSTENGWYAERLRSREGKWWKKRLHVQAPYQWNLRRQDLGRTLDIGCGIGRNLGTLPAGSLGVDHNATAVREARSRGLSARTSEEFLADPPEHESFDSLLMAHVVEHMDEEAAQRLLRDYLPFVRTGGQVFLVCPQERGYASDPTHVRYLDARALERLLGGAGLVVQQTASFPFPALVGKVFVYNEFTALATKP